MKKLNSWFITYAGTAAQFLFGLGTSIILARTLGPDDRGLLAALMFWPAFLFQIFYFSLNEATSRQIAHARGHGQDPLATARAALLLHVGIAFWVSLIFALALPFLLQSQHMHHLQTVLVYGLLFSFLTPFHLYGMAVLSGIGAFGKVNIVRLLQPFLYFVFIFILLLLYKLQVTTILSAIIVALFIAAILAVAFSGAPLPAWNRNRIRTLTKTAARFHVMNLALYVGTELDKLLVIRLASNEEIGFYAIALAYAMLGAGFLVSSYSVMTYAEIASLTDRSKQVAKMAQYARHAMLAIVLINGMAAVAASWALPFIYGAEFAPAVPIALVLLLAMTAKGLRQILDRALRALLNTRIALLSELLAMAAFLLLFATFQFYSGRKDILAISISLAMAQLLALGFMLYMMNRTFSELKYADMWGLRPRTMRNMAARLLSLAMGLVGNKGN